jgi:ribosomal protein L11 methyltransferase
MAERAYPALEVRWRQDPASELIERLIAAVDDLGPTAVEERGSAVVVYFATTGDRDEAVALARASAPDADVTALSISDDDWAERSQASLGPVRVGRLVLAPPWTSPAVVRPETSGPSTSDDIVLTIVPSMGFGTGHHASTRLCLALMQVVRLDGRDVLDVGTGSGVLALAAWRLGARRIVAIDNDPDALRAAAENLAANAAPTSVELRRLDLASAASALPDRFDVITANLTGGLLRRCARVLAASLAPGGSAIVSGVLEDEAHEVMQALADGGLTLDRLVAEDGWVGLRLDKTAAP